MFPLIQPTVLLGLLAAFFWGGGDFSGGMGAKYAGGTMRGALRVIIVSHSASFCIMLVIALLRGDALLHGVPLLCGLAAGVTGGLSLVCFYVALARGAMGAAAAISGLAGAAIPTAVSIFFEGSPGAVRLAGFLIAAIAIWLVAAAPAKALEGDQSEGHPARSTLLLAIIAGAGFGLYFVLLKFAGASGASGIAWPMAAARTGSLATCSILVLCLTWRPGAILAEGSSTSPFALPRTAILWSLSTAVLDTCGNLLFLAATRAGRLDIAAVLASLYPATTILLAGFVLKERFSRRQVIGMAIAAVAVVMVAV